MNIGYANDRYGIPAKLVKNLSGRYRRQGLEEGFGTFDDFLRWCGQVGYKPGHHLRRHDPDKPHGPDNSYFREPGRAPAPPKSPEPPKKRGAKPIAAVSPFCEGCTRECPAHGRGCREWQEYFVQNWDGHLHDPAARATVPKPAPAAPDPNAVRYFRYEHPDLVRKANGGKND